MAKAKAKAKDSVRVIGRNGESMYIEDEELCFKTANKVQSMPLEVVRDIGILNAEEARESVRTEDLVPYGKWTGEMPSTGGNTAFLAVRGRASLWVMEINKSQVPNASGFANRVKPKPKDEDDESRLWVPNRAINTPLGALFTIGSILCVLLAIFLVFSFQQPLLGLLAAAAAIIMFIKIK